MTIPLNILLIIYTLKKIITMTTEIRLFQKFEPEIQRGQLKSCQICGTKFGVFVPEHQCKRCFRAVCSGCGSAKKDVYKPKMNRKPHRICKLCNIESTILSEYIAANKLRFGEDCEIAIKWKKKIPKPVRNHNNVKQQRKFTTQIFNQLWDAYNFSLREFIGLNTFLIGQGQVYKLTNTVYNEIQSRGVEQKLENVILIIIFMLCFSNIDTCANLVEYLCNLKKSVADHKQMLQTYLKVLGIQDSESKKLNDYISYEFKHFLGPFSINAVTAQCSIHVITKAFEKQRVDQTYMLLAIILQENWQYLTENRANKNQCDYWIIRNCNMSNYIEKYRSLVTVKVAQFTSIRASMRNSATQVENDERLKSFAVINQDVVMKSPGSTPPKPPMNKKQSLELKSFDEPIENMTKKESQLTDARTKALQNIARIKERNQKKFEKKEQQSVQSFDEKEQKPTMEKGQSKKDKNDILMQFGNAIFQNNGSSQKKKQSEPFKIKLQQSIKQKQPQTELQKTKQPIVYFQKQHCSQCIKKDERLSELMQNINKKSDDLEVNNRIMKSKDIQIQKLKLEIKRLNQQRDLQKQKEAQKNKSSPEEIDKLKQQLSDSTEKYNNLMKQFLKFQRETKTLKNQIEQLGMNNKILKSKLEQSEMGLSVKSKISQNEEELSRMNQLMKKSIEGKNKELQLLSKKNKELSAQLDQFLKSQSIQNTKQSEKAKKLQKQKEELMLKMKDLGERVVKEEEEKLGLSEELFELRRQSAIILPVSQTKQQKEPQPSSLKARASQCSIF